MSEQSKEYPMTWEEAVNWLRNEPTKEDLVKACFFDDPLLEAAERFYQSAEWQAIHEYLPCTNDKKVLDLGAGRGISSYALAKDGWQVTALEPDPSMLVGAGAIRELARESGFNINVVENWGEQLPFEDNSFDLVYARQALHHAYNLSTLCQEVARVLRPGGIFIATREHVVARPEDLPVFWQYHPLHYQYGGENAFTLSQYINAMDNAGLYFKKILTPLESPINYFPATENETTELLSSFWKWKNKPSKADLINNSRYILNIPGMLFTFIATKDADIRMEKIDPNNFKLALDSEKIKLESYNNSIISQLNDIIAKYKYIDDVVIKQNDIIEQQKIIMQQLVTLNQKVDHTLSNKIRKVIKKLKTMLVSSKS